MRFSFDPALPSGRRIRSLATVGESGAVVDRVVEFGELSGDPALVIKVVTLDFLANLGDGLPIPAPHPSRIDLNGEAAQPNAPDPDFPDTNGNGVIDGPVLTDPGWSHSLTRARNRTPLPSTWQPSIPKLRLTWLRHLLCSTSESRTWEFQASRIQCSSHNPGERRWPAGGRCAVRPDPRHGHGSYTVFPPTIVRST
jgi:hypothetical protein